MLKLPDHFSLVDEQKNHYLIHDHRDDKRFHVAKNDLGVEMHAKLKGIKKYSDGGLFDMSPTQGLYTPAAPTQPLYTPASFQNQPGVASPAATQPIAQAPNQNQLNAQAIDDNLDYNKLQSLGIGPTAGGTKDLPKETGPTKVDVGSLETGNQQTTQPQVPGLSPQKELESAFGQAKGAIADQTSAEQKQYQELEQQYKNDQTKYQKLSDNHDERATFLNQRSNELFDAASKGEIDPERYWKTHSRTMGMLGILIGGISTESNGNMAMNEINKNIDRDIESQQKNLDQKNNLFRMNLEQTKNEHDAYLQSKADYLTMAAAKVNEIAARAGTPLAQAKGQQMLAQLGVQIAQIHSQMATTEISREATTNGIPQELLSRLSPEQNAKMVRLPNGKWADAGSSENAKTYNEQADAFVPLMQDLSALKQLNTLGSRVSPEQRAKANELQGHIVVQLNDMAKSHRISESDIGFQKGQLSDPTAIKTLFSGNAATEQLEQSLLNKMEAVGGNRVPAWGAMRAGQKSIKDALKSKEIPRLTKR